MIKSGFFAVGFFMLYRAGGPGGAGGFLKNGNGLDIFFITPPD
jgi:hypothetical protein